MIKHLALLAAVVAVLLIAAPAKAGTVYGCDAESTYDQCIAQDPSFPTGTGTSSTICTDTYGCLWCDLNPEKTASVCTRHIYSPGWCACTTKHLTRWDYRTGQPAPLCETLTGSCRYV